MEFFVNWKDCLYNLLKKHGYAVGHAGKFGIWAPYNKSDIDFMRNEEGWHYHPVNKNLHITEKNEADSLKFLRTRDKQKPFFLNTAFFATHAMDNDPNQYTPQNRSRNMYRHVQIPTPITATQEAWENMPPFFNEHNEARVRWCSRYNTTQKFQSMMKKYYRMATEVDSACGAIIEELRIQGELDNTLIIFTTDNGNFHGEHGIADKWYPHKESINVPLIIKDPRMSAERAGMVNEDFTLNLDLAPTILHAAGIKPPPQMMGRDMADIYLKKDTKWRNEFFYEHPMHRDSDYIPASEALVRKDYKYLYWPDFDFHQLFHTKADPYEEHDLVSSTESKHQAALVQMKERFLELKDIIHDMSKNITV